MLKFNAGKIYMYYLLDDNQFKHVIQQYYVISIVFFIIYLFLSQQEDSQLHFTYFYDDIFFCSQDVIHMVHNIFYLTFK